jgi:cell division protein FtsB
MAAGTRNSFGAIRRAALPAVAFLIIANFLGYAVMGSNGILSWGDYRRLHAQRAVELTQLQEEKVRLANRAALLDPRRADPDLADEMVRSQLGLVRPDEVVVEIKD